MSSINTIPKKLREYHQWILWEAIPESDGKLRKVPMAAATYPWRPCDPHDPKHWMPAENAANVQNWYRVRDSRILNLGFVLTQNDPFVCVDLDGCRDPVTQRVSPWADEVVKFLSSYTEVSPSGTGLKVFVTSTDTDYIRVSQPVCADAVSVKPPQVEIFSARQFMAITGQVYACLPVEDRTNQVRHLVAQYPSTPNASSCLTEFRDNPDADLGTFEAARTYLSEMPLAETGNRGHDTTYAVACCLMIDFALSFSQALELMEDWNCHCLPPWSTRELKHKLQHAGRLNGERGWRAPAALIAAMVKVIEADGWFRVQHEAPLAESASTNMFQPFPVEMLPTRLRTFVRSVSAAIGCDETFVALPVLATCAAAIGNSRRLIVKDGWIVPSILWCVIIGESGTQKTPAIKAATKPILTRQSEMSETFREESRQFRIRKAEQRGARRNTSNIVAASDGNVDPPICQRCVVSDVTIEGLVSVLQDNPRGVLLSRDELSGWIGSFDKYSNSGRVSADAAHWLSIYSGQGIIVDRKSGDQRSLVVPRPVLSVCGGIQPGILKQALGPEHRENGLMARLLFTFPPRQQKRWTEASISRAVEDDYASVLNALLDLRGNSIDVAHRAEDVRLSPQAQQLFIEYVNVTGEEQAKLCGDLAAAWSKLEEIPARLALVVHSVRFVSGETSDAFLCDHDSMQMAISLATWFKCETQRIYSQLSETPQQQQQRQLCEWIARRGGKVRTRELVSSKRSVPNAITAERLLEELVRAGFGIWTQSVNASGPAAREFVLQPRLDGLLSAGSA